MESRLKSATGKSLQPKGEEGFYAELGGMSC
jgi:hypothetical protein